MPSCLSSEMFSEIKTQALLFSVVFTWFVFVSEHGVRFNRPNVLLPHGESMANGGCSESGGRFPGGLMGYRNLEHCTLLANVFIKA